MSKKHKHEDLTFDESIKVASRKELRKIVRHFHELNIMTVTQNYNLQETCRVLQDELSESRLETAHKDRLLQAVVNS